MTGVIINKLTQVSIDVSITEAEVRELILDAARKKLKRKLPEGVVITLNTTPNSLEEDDGIPSAQVNYAYTA